MNDTKNIFNILSIDGGGIRGVFPAHILKCISQQHEVEIDNHFDMLAGTSTGSIIAAAVACKIDPEKIVSLYCEHGSSIFTPRKSYWPRWPKDLRPIANSIYSSEGLNNILIDIFADIKLGDIQTPLLLPSTDIGSGNVHIFKSNYSIDFTRDQDVLVRKAVLASCSAPTYFDPSKVDEYLLADGGLWANNPSLAAVIDAQRRLNVNINNIRILSLGTGHAKKCYGVNTNRSWGFLRGWGGPEFVSFIMSLQAQATHNYLQLMLREDQLLRINFESDLPLPLDDCSKIDDMISRADYLFTHKSAAIKKFINKK